jgi:hypothetical protein
MEVMQVIEGVASIWLLLLLLFGMLQLLGSCLELGSTFPKRPTSFYQFIGGCACGRLLLLLRLEAALPFGQLLLGICDQLLRSASHAA